ncbi:hypothetical protein ACQPV1_08680 [Clostridium neonatale]|uniref:hypothetical protein n=1 Tax=Clostridium neonatale TaxID=137838 RepID=UPI003D335A8B
MRVKNTNVFTEEEINDIRERLLYLREKLGMTSDLVLGWCRVCNTNEVKIASKQSYNYFLLGKYKRLNDGTLELLQEFLNHIDKIIKTYLNK